MARVSLENFSRSFIFGALAEVWRVGSRFVVTPIVLAVIGPYGYGVWTLLFSLAAYVSIANVGFGVAYTKFTAECVRAQDYQRLRGIIGAGIAGVGALAFGGLLIAWLAGAAILRALNVPEERVADGRIAMMIVMTVLVARLTVGCSLEVLAGLQRVDLSHRLTILSSFVEFAITLPLLLLGHGLIGMAIGYAVGQLSCFSLGFRWVKREDPQISISPLYATRAGLREVMNIGGRMQGLAFVHVAIAEGVKVLLAVMIDPRATALYELADKLVTLCRTPTAAVVGPMMAAFADLQAGGEDARKRDLLQRGWKAVAIVSFAVSMFLGVTAGPALLVWTGQAFPIAAWAVQMMVLGSVFAQQTAVHSASLRASGKVRLEFLFAVVSSGIAVVLLIVLVRYSPFEAVVWSRVIAQILGASWYLGAFLRQEGISVRTWWRAAGFGPVLLVVAGAGAVTLLGSSLLGIPALPVTPRWGALLNVAVWGIPYAAILGVGLWRYALDSEERTQLGALLRRRLQRLRRR